MNNTDNMYTRLHIDVHGFLFFSLNINKIFFQYANKHILKDNDSDESNMVLNTESREEKLQRPQSYVMALA